MVNLPRANFTVLIPVSSSFVVLNIFAPASELEYRGGKIGLICGECEKNSGDVGAKLLVGTVKLNGSRVCRLDRPMRNRFRKDSRPPWLDCVTGSAERSSARFTEVLSDDKSMCVGLGAFDCGVLKKGCPSPDRGGAGVDGS